MYSFFVYCKKLLCVKKFKLLLLLLSLSPQRNHPQTIALDSHDFFLHCTAPKNPSPPHILQTKRKQDPPFRCASAIAVLRHLFVALFPLVFLCPPPPLSFAFIRSQITMCVQVYTGTVCTLQDNESTVWLQCHTDLPGQSAQNPTNRKKKRKASIQTYVHRSR